MSEWAEGMEGEEEDEQNGLIMCQNAWEGWKWQGRQQEEEISYCPR